MDKTSKLLWACVITGLVALIVGCVVWVISHTNWQSALAALAILFTGYWTVSYEW